MKLKAWSDAAELCETDYGCFADYKEGYFICPECDEPIYLEDWLTHDDWNLCPVCEFNFVKGE